MSSIPIYPSEGRQLRLTVAQDGGAKKKYGFMYKPPVWEADKVYRCDKHACIPVLFNGFYYVVVSNGVSAGTEPAWPTEDGLKITDGTVEWLAIEYTLMLGGSEYLSASTWEASAGVTEAPSFSAAGVTEVMLSQVPAGTPKVTLTNTVTKDNGEVDVRSVIISIAEK